MELNPTIKLDEMVNYSKQRLAESEQRRQKFIQRMKTLRDRSDKVVERRIQRMRNNGINISLTEFRNRPDIKALRKANELDNDFGTISLELTKGAIVDVETFDSMHTESEKTDLDESEYDSDRDIVDTELYVIGAPATHQSCNQELITQVGASLRPVNTVDSGFSGTESKAAGIVGNQSGTEVKKMISSIGQLSKSKIKYSHKEGNRMNESHSPWSFLLNDSVQKSNIGKQAPGAAYGIQKLKPPSDFQAHPVPEIVIEEVKHRVPKYNDNVPSGRGNLKIVSKSPNDILKTTADNTSEETRVMGAETTVMSAEMTSISAETTVMGAETTPIGAETTVMGAASNSKVAESGVLENLLHHVLNDPSPENISILKELIREQGDSGVDLSLLEPFMTESVTGVTEQVADLSVSLVDSTPVEEDGCDNIGTKAELNKVSSSVKTVSLKEEKQPKRTKTTRSKGVSQTRKGNVYPSGENLKENFAFVEAFLNKHSGGDTSDKSKTKERLKRVKLKLAVVNAMSDGT